MNIEMTRKIAETQSSNTESPGRKEKETIILLGSGNLRFGFEICILYLVFVTGH